ncbi:hypothetical protein MAPG_10538 [Magnaporthiopsis poae ATCC 64411]|uniref:Uncharacterized protein n=1 Tax=Magnaporthiopsis poae (strain ATCC 64411 / 73-15) TaxID=644358 RepID=A0A0C4ECV2_MAGP6|nr:hypothetical protein MAPG_10538 [Magnaporthiopsis poae ATCC 64411]
MNIKFCDNETRRIRPTTPTPSLFLFRGFRATRLRFTYFTFRFGTSTTARTRLHHRGQRQTQIPDNETRPIGRPFLFLPFTTVKKQTPVAERAPPTRKNSAPSTKANGTKKKTSDPTDDSESTSEPPVSSEEPTESASTVTPGFANKTYENGILPPISSKPPANLDQILKRYARSRATASPPTSEHGLYNNNVSTASTKTTVLIEVSEPLKRHGDRGYGREFNQPFTNIPLNAEYNNGLSAPPQPDFVEGLRKRTFTPFPVADSVPEAVIYEKDPFSLTLPHAAGERRERGKDLKKAELRAAYNGAATVYARNKARAYTGKSDPPGYAAVTTFATNGTILSTYAHYATPSPENELEYHQYEYASTHLGFSYKGYKEGRRGLRNAQDHAREQLYALKDQLRPCRLCTPAHGGCGL